MLTSADIKLQIERSGDQYAISAPRAKPEAARVFAAMLSTISRVGTTGKENKQALEKSGDVFADLEMEMANDTVSDSVTLRKDMQDMAAMHLLSEFENDPGTVVRATSDEMVELAYWFNRRRHVLHAAANGDRESSVFLLALACSLWSQQLLEEADD